MLLADVARHVSNALEKDRGIKATETLARIREIFEAELNSPTGTPTGNFA
ncbi:MAG: DUF5076 domain-containing protein [Acidobacteria bacterium]|nr:DUF5076 domain-containing protein [Acidobacteriota bacterium]